MTSTNNSTGSNGDKKNNAAPASSEGRPQPLPPSADGHLWRKCRKCDWIIYEKELKENLLICPKCQEYFRMSPQERVEMLVDNFPAGFKEFQGQNYISTDPLGFPGYKEKIKKLPPSDGILSGYALIGGHKTVLLVMDFEVMGGSMGSVVGEKVTRAAEISLKERLPLIIVSASGGARMQEGILSLMQMAKTSAALARLHSARIPFISVLTDPTTGGVSASYAMLGDINIAEQGALIGFAGPRVIEETIKQKLPEGFQRSEFLLAHGMVDIVSPRKELKKNIVSALDILDTAGRQTPAGKSKKYLTNK